MGTSRPATSPRPTFPASLSPPAWIWEPAKIPCCTYDAPPGWAWGTYLLPYMEYDGLYKQLNLNLPCYDPANKIAVATAVKEYLCPGATNNSPPCKSGN